MKEQISELLQDVLRELQQQGDLPADFKMPSKVENSRDPGHGDFSSNLALRLSNVLYRPAREIAEMLRDMLPPTPQVLAVKVAGPGFLNFFVDAEAQAQVVADILEQGAQYGRKAPCGERVLVEFVSANPTGPLHVGHGRGAAYGDIVANLLESTGFEVVREYYVNDSGRQMDILALSTWLRYLEMCGETLVFPAGVYQGEYILEPARALFVDREREWLRSDAELTACCAVLAESWTTMGREQREELLDALIERARTLLGEDIFTQIRRRAGDFILTGIRRDLEDFGVHFQNWFRESDLSEEKIAAAIRRLQEAGCTKEHGGALWFLATHFGDDKDRVLRRSNGQPTYFAADLAYHLDKFERGHARLVNVWGADHHGYVKRLHAALQALDIAPERLEVRLTQLVSLKRGGRPVPMSTRGGSFIRLRELYTETGVDAARFFYTMRRAEQPAEFDLALAKSQERDNPVYYIQYAHARVCSLRRQMEQNNISWQPERGLDALHRLDTREERELIARLGTYPERLQHAAQKWAPNRFADFLRELAAEFHNCYNQHRVLVEEDELRNARVCLAEAVRQVIANGLTILGMSAPEKM